MDFVVDFSKTPELGGKAPVGQKVKPGYLADYGAVSPELLQPRMEVERFNKGMVFDASRSPELANTRESVLAGQAAKDLSFQARQEEAAVGGILPTPEPRGAAALAAAEGTSVAAAVQSAGTAELEEGVSENE